MNYPKQKANSQVFILKYNGRNSAFEKSDWQNKTRNLFCF